MLHYDKLLNTFRLARERPHALDGFQARLAAKECPRCGSVSNAKLKGQSVVITPHPPRKVREVAQCHPLDGRKRGWELVQKEE